MVIFHCYVSSPEGTTWGCAMEITDDVVCSPQELQFSLVESTMIAELATFYGWLSG